MKTLLATLILFASAQSYAYDSLWCMTNSPEGRQEWTFTKETMTESMLGFETKVEKAGYKISLRAFETNPSLEDSIVISIEDSEGNVASTVGHKKAYLAQAGKVNELGKRKGIMFTCILDDAK